MESINMNHSDNISAQPPVAYRRKIYCMPAIIVELDLETRAGNSAFNPGGASQEDNSLETFTSK